ncbi:MAG: hypothetical protein C4325_10745 [Blastocatellia bacterium]
MPNNKREFYEIPEPVDDEIKEIIEEEIEHAPKAPFELEERLVEHYPASPADSGGDIDADWEEALTTGSEAVFGHNPTPDQSVVEENAEAMGIHFEDNEPLDFIGKLEKRDRDRFELREASKADDESI